MSNSGPKFQGRLNVLKVAGATPNVFSVRQMCSSKLLVSFIKFINMV